VSGARIPRDYALLILDAVKRFLAKVESARRGKGDPEILKKYESLKNAMGFNFVTPIKPEEYLWYLESALGLPRSKLGRKPDVPVESKRPQNPRD